MYTHADPDEGAGEGRGWGGDAVAGATVAVAIARLLLRFVYACAWTQRDRARPLSKQRRERTSPTNPVPVERGRGRTHNALQAAGLKPCGFISSCLERHSCVWIVREGKRTYSQAGKTALHRPCGQAAPRPDAPVLQSRLGMTGGKGGFGNGGLLPIFDTS